MMGGCFAQDETSQTVDTYWVAEMVQLVSTVSNAKIAVAPFEGGSSEDDEMEVTLQADQYYDCYLIASVRPQATSHKKGIVIFSGAGDFHVLGQENGNTDKWYEPLKQKFTWWMRNGLYKRGDDVGTLYAYQREDSEARDFCLGSSLKALNRIIYNANYCNKRTGVRLQWQPMAGMTGTAFFEPTTGTLAEQ